MKTISTFIVRCISIIVIAAAALTNSNVAAVERVTYYHNDALGSPVAATDQAGNLLWQEQYLPYGDRTLRDDADSNSRWYTGKQEEADFGINYFGARWYDPSIGRFLGIDPVGYSYSNLSSFNRYAYANNNPYVYIDPDGRAAYFANDGTFLESLNPQDDNVYLRSATNGQVVNTSLNISVGDFNVVSATVYGEGPAVGRTVAESTATANVVNNRAQTRSQSIVESASSGHFFGRNNDAAIDYLTNWTRAGITEAPAARAGVISVLSGQADTTGGRTMFEGTNLLSSPRSSFQRRYVDTGIAYDPLRIQDTTYFRERTAEQAARVLP